MIKAQYKLTELDTTPLYGPSSHEVRFGSFNNVHLPALPGFKHLRRDTQPVINPLLIDPRRPSGMSFSFDPNEFLVRRLSYMDSNERAQSNTSPVDHPPHIAQSQRSTSSIPPPRNDAMIQAYQSSRRDSRTRSVVSVTSSISFQGSPGPSKEYPYRELVNTVYHENKTYDMRCEQGEEQDDETEKKESKSEDSKLIRRSRVTHTPEHAGASWECNTEQPKEANVTLIQHAVNQASPAATYSVPRNMTTVVVNHTVFAEGTVETSLPYCVTSRTFVQADEAAGMLAVFCDDKRVAFIQVRIFIISRLG